MKLATNKDSLTITFEGMGNVWALRHKIIIPKNQILDISWHETFTNKDFGTVWRMAGTGAPWLLYAGYFHGGGKRQFYYVKWPRGFFHTTAKNILRIETKDNFPQRRILLTTNPQAANSVIKWFVPSQTKP